MIEYKTGSIFDSAAQCLVNPVNTVGVMGAGLALEFKRRYPDMYQSYVAMCKDNSLQVGQVMFWHPKLRPDFVICLFPTKQHFRDKSTLIFVENGLRSFVKYAPFAQIKSVAFPKLGCGLGGLHFEHHVQPLLEKYLSNTPFTVEVYV